MFSTKLLIPSNKVHGGLKAEELENRETHGDCAVIVPNINKEIDPFSYMIATKASSQISVFQRRSNCIKHK